MTHSASNHACRLVLSVSFSPFIHAPNEQGAIDLTGAASNKDCSCRLGGFDVHLSPHVTLVGRGVHVEGLPISALNDECPSGLGWGISFSALGDTYSA